MKPISWRKYIHGLSKLSLHIVSFDVPFPPDYGGAIDVFYRIKALHELGLKITLHCYEYGRGIAPELEEITEKVIYYKRRKRLFDVLHRLPFIVQTRRSTELMDRLMSDTAPILFEGLHTTFFLGDDRLKNRIKMVRTHNIEHEYYGHLANNASDIKHWFFKRESRKLKRFEPILNHADFILPITSADIPHFSMYLAKVQLLSPCFATIFKSAQQETKPYVLFHGNLSVSENAVSVQWLLEHVFPVDGVHFVVAGKNPTEKLTALQQKHDFELIANPTSEEMQELISNARVHALHTDQRTGIKLKLIQSLQTPGHVIVNPTMVTGTDLESYCTVVTEASEWKAAIQNALKLELNVDEFQRRVHLFEEQLNTNKTCQLISAIVDSSSSKF